MNNKIYDNFIAGKYTIPIVICIVILVAIAIFHIIFTICENNKNNNDNDKLNNERIDTFLNFGDMEDIEFFSED